MGKALVSAAAKLPSAEADKAAAQLALQAQDQAAAGLSADNQQKRAQSARDALTRATAAWQVASASKDPASIQAASLFVQAAQNTYAKTQNQQLTNPLTPGAPAGNNPGQKGQLQAATGQSFLSTPLVGPVTTGMALGGGALATVAYLLLRRH